MQFLGPRRDKPRRTREEWAATDGFGWLQLGKCWYQAGAGPETGPWELLRRVPAKDADPSARHEVGAVDMLTTVRKGAQEWLLLVAVYRPPVDAWSLEFPAGMIDPGETPVEAGRRELLEETGFTARHEDDTLGGDTLPSIICFADPWKSSEAYHSVHMQVDATDPANVDPTQKLEADEHIMPMLAPAGAALLPALMQLVAEEGFVLEARVAGFAQGLAYAARARPRL